MTKLLGKSIEIPGVVGAGDGVSAVVGVGVGTIVKEQNVL